MGSTIGGYIRPTTVPVMGQSFNRILQQHIVGCTGMPGKLVTPRYQERMPTIPADATAWCAFGNRVTRSDTFSTEYMDGGTLRIFRWEEIELLLSFYDDGVSGNAEQYAKIFRQCLQIPQNNDQIRQYGVTASHCGDLIPVPTVVNEKWLYRVDIEATFRRQLEWGFDISTFTSAEVILQCEDAAGKMYTETILVSP